MDLTSINLLLIDALRRRERLNDHRGVIADGAEAYGALAVDAEYPPQRQQQYRLRQIEALGRLQRYDTALFHIDSEIRSLKLQRAEFENATDAQAAHVEFFNRVRQVVATNNVVPLPSQDHSPEAA